MIYHLLFILIIIIVYGLFSQSVKEHLVISPTNLYTKLDSNEDIVLCNSKNNSYLTKQQLSDLLFKDSNIINKKFELRRKFTNGFHNGYKWCKAHIIKTKKKK